MNLAQVVGVRDLHLEDARIVSARRVVGALREFDALFESGLVGSGQNRVEIALAALFERRLFDLRRAGRDQRGDLRGMADFFRAEIVAVGVAGAFARDDAHADAERNALRGALDDRFIDADGTGGEVFEIEVGIVAAAPQRFGEVGFQIPPRDAEFSGEKGIGKAHN